MGLPLTPTLNNAKNDTGRTAYCGPIVVSAITGFSVSRIEAAIHTHRADPKEARRIIEGTTPEEIAAALAVLGRRMERVESYWSIERRERPTLSEWLRRPRSTFQHYVLAIHRGRDGHWIVIKGAKLCDTFTDGEWVFAVDGPHKGVRIMEVYRVVAVEAPLPAG